MMFWFVHSKSKASPIASRMRAVLELLAADVEVPALHAGTASRRGDGLALDAALAHGREVVAGRPGRGR